MRGVAQSLADAARAMRAAEQKLQARDPQQALPPEQQALGNLLRAEEAYRDVRVAMSNERGGVGGGGRQSSPEAEELADLFQLEMDKLRNQYETVQRAQQQTTDNQVDEMLERLKELARRQEQEAERQRQLAANRQSAGDATAARQRQLAEDTEEAARRLERLSRDEGRPDLATAPGNCARPPTRCGGRPPRRRGRVRRGKRGGRTAGSGARSAAAGTDRSAAREIDNAITRVRRLAEEQERIEREVRALPQAGADRRTRAGRVLERKDVEATEVADLERQLDRTAADFRRERPDAAQKVQESADAIRDSRVKEKIDYSKGLVQGAPPESAAGFEEQIGADIQSIERRLREAAGAAGAAERDRSAEALERARALVSGVETMDQRMRERLGQQRRTRRLPGARGGRANPGARASRASPGARAVGGPTRAAAASEAAESGEKVARTNAAEVRPRGRGAGRRRERSRLDRRAAGGWGRRAAAARRVRAGGRAAVRPRGARAQGRCRRVETRAAGARRRRGGPRRAHPQPAGARQRARVQRSRRGHSPAVTTDRGLPPIRIRSAAGAR